MWNSIWLHGWVLNFILILCGISRVQRYRKLHRPSHDSQDSSLNYGIFTHPQEWRGKCSIYEPSLNIHMTMTHPYILLPFVVLSVKLHSHKLWGATGWEYLAKITTNNNHWHLRMRKNESKSLSAALCHCLNITVYDEDGRDPEKSRTISCIIVAHHAKLITEFTFWASVRKIH